jgi:hypothetical protein
MHSGVNHGCCDVEVLGFGELLKWYEKWTCPQTRSLQSGPFQTVVCHCHSAHKAHTSILRSTYVESKLLGALVGLQSRNSVPMPMTKYDVKRVG